MVDKDIWDQVQAVAYSKQTSISQMIRDYLRGVVSRERHSKASKSDPTPTLCNQRSPLTGDDTGQ